MNIIIIPRLHSPLRAWAYKPTSGLISAYPQIEVKYHAASLRVTYDQQFEYPGFPLEISIYPISSRY